MDSETPPFIRNLIQDVARVRLKWKRFTYRTPLVEVWLSHEGEVRFYREIERAPDHMTQRCYSGTAIWRVVGAEVFAPTEGVPVEGEYSIRLRITD